MPERAERKAKIVATLGPATSKPDMIAALVDAGMDCARLNFSHGTHDDHRRNLGLVRQAAEKAGRAVAVLQDLQGPKIRVGKLRGGSLQLRPGDTVTLTTRSVVGSKNLVPTDYKGLPKDVMKGDPILLDDGRLVLTVLKSSRQDVQARVEIGGALSDRKGINLPGSAVSIPALTDKDKHDLEFGLSVGVDFVALSFVRSAEDVRLLRKLIAGSGARIIAKIEKPQAVEDADAIATAADGLMIARGDLGVEMPLVQVPIIQKHLIERTNAHGKIAIVATQMLDSMIERPTPTRAEVSDVANAVLDGADAVMLSGETASGKHPLRAVQTMAAIIREVERSPRYQALPDIDVDRAEDTFANAIAKACATAARRLGIGVVVALTQTGETARLIAEYRTSARIVAFTPDREAYRRMALYFGVTPYLTEWFDSTEQMMAGMTKTLLDKGIARRGEAIIVASGVPVTARGTNALQIHRL